MKYVNEEEKFWKHSYRVYLHDTEGLLINADNEQDALDYAVDYAEEQGWVGLFLDETELEEAIADNEDIIFAGNHGLALSSSDYIHIKQID
jgi:hypothetical protein